MAAVVIMRRRGGNSSLQEAGPNLNAMDCDDELHAAIRHEGFEKEKRKAPLGAKIDPKINVSPDSLMGKMPKGDKVVKEGSLEKYAGANQWKPLRVVLTAVGIFLSRPNEDLLRDLIPLYEVLEVKKKNRLEPTSSIVDKSAKRLDSSSSFRNLNFSSLVSKQDPVADSGTHVIQIRTIEDGYNSGRVYLLRAESEDECTTWIQSIRSGVRRAIMLKEAGPGFFRKTQFRVARFYRSVGMQSFVAVLIFLSFLANILQSEYTSDDADTVFNGLEYFFTIAFTVELVINMLSNLFLPFFKV
jgi:hypothetical protein